MTVKPPLSMRRHAAFVVPSVLALAVAGDLGAAGPCSEQQKLLASDAVAEDQLGFSVSISGDTAVVGAWLEDNAGGASAGSAYVYVRASGVWTQQQKLLASDGAPSDWFGYSVSISGDTIVVGASAADILSGGINAGAAYVYVRRGSVWTEEQKLVASDAATNGVFGISGSVAGDTVVVGASQENAVGGAGAAYVYVRSGGIWTEQQKLVASDGAVRDFFGRSVALFGDMVVVGATSADNPRGVDAGAAYVYVRSGGVWTQEQKLVASDAAASDSLGSAVSISSDTVVVGANNADDVPIVDVGVAYVYVRSGGIWTEEQKLVASDATGSASLGVSVSLSGDTAVVGAWSDDNAGGLNAGAAYVYVRSGAVWTEQRKIVASDAARDDYFGNSVAIDGDTAVVGAVEDNNAGGGDAGSAYVYVACCADEPSALDLRPAAPPLLVMKGAAVDTVDLAWQDTGVPKYHLYGGNIADLAPARPVPDQVLCDVLLPVATADATGLGRWFLVVASCGAIESSLGRDSTGRERDAPLMPCP